ncbi:MAG: hypothetical protein A2W03_13115 [Candidatus Aminicenantes bacterium RBG_16_63_16]|nr:MAG: hypothetical protein A2W03_13115 [Candidatus Aminicenantes bacterium RBG_16_63_16]
MLDPVLELRGLFGGEGIGPPLGLCFLVRFLLLLLGFYPGLVVRIRPFFDAADLVLYDGPETAALDEPNLHLAADATLEEFQVPLASDEVLGPVFLGQYYRQRRRMSRARVTAVRLTRLRRSAIIRPVLPDADRGPGQDSVKIDRG